MIVLFEPMLHWKLASTGAPTSDTIPSAETVKVPEMGPLLPSDSTAIPVKVPSDAMVTVPRSHQGAPGPEARLLASQVPSRSASVYWTAPPKAADAKEIDRIMKSTNCTNELIFLGMVIPRNEKMRE
jgi:hypothetical protein